MKNIKVANQHFKEKYGIDDFFSVKQIPSVNLKESYDVISPFNSRNYQKYELQLTNFIELGEAYLQTRSRNMDILECCKQLCPSFHAKIIRNVSRLYVQVRLFGISFCLELIDKKFKSNLYFNLFYSFTDEGMLPTTIEEFAKQKQSDQEYQKFWRYAIENDFSILYWFVHEDESKNVPEISSQATEKFLASLSNEIKDAYHAMEILYDLKSIN